VPLAGIGVALLILLLLAYGRNRLLIVHATWSTNACRRGW
jgi:hypothetical protein